MVPNTARRELSETLENTDVVSAFLDPSAGLRPQTLAVQFGYFSGLQSWAPVLIPVLFFALGNLAGPVRSEEHTSELQSRVDLVCRLLLEKKKNTKTSSLMSTSA